MEDRKSYNQSNARVEQVMDEIYRMVSEGRYDELLDLIKRRMNPYNVRVRFIRKMVSIRKRAFFKLIRDLETGKVDTLDFLNIRKIVSFLDIDTDEVSQLYEKIAHSYQATDELLF